jgi:ABC-type ATPase with predicted acetyltransferase domain
MFLRRVAWLIIKPGLRADGIGLAIFAVVFISQWLRKKRGTTAPVAGA